MTNRHILPNLKPTIYILCLFCAFFCQAQRSVDVLFSPVSTIEHSSAQISSVSVLADSILFLEVEITPSSNLQKMSVGIDPKTLLVSEGKTFAVQEIFPRVHDSWNPQINPDGFLGWYNVNAGEAYHAILTFILPSLSTLECFSIIPSDSSLVSYQSGNPDDTELQGYYSFRDVKINPSVETASKAFETMVLKPTQLYSEPSTKSKKLQKLSPQEKICIIEPSLDPSQDVPQNHKNTNSKFYRAIILSSGVSGYLEKDAVSGERTNLELITDAIKLSKKGNGASKDVTEGYQSKLSEDFAQIEILNKTRTTITIAINDAKIEIDPLTMQTFRVRVDGLHADSKAKGKGKGKDKSKGNTEKSYNNYQYLVVQSEDLPPTIVRCRLNGGDYYHWEFSRGISFFSIF